MKILFKAGRIVNCDQEKVCDLLIEDKKIVAIADEIDADDALVIDARGLLVMPGFVDMHCHLRDPGYEYKETIRTGTMAAARGGFTTIACMPNTNPVVDNKVVLEYIKSKAVREGVVNVLPIGAITKGLNGEELSEMGELKENGVVALSDDGKSVMNAGLMKRALSYARMLDMLVISHCEDVNITGEGVMNSGYMATLLGLKGMPAEAEEVMISRDAILALHTGARLHIAHVSTKISTDIIRWTKKMGVNITAEVTPHHLSLTEEEVDGYNTDTKVNPPLRTREDIMALIDGLKDGTIDCIATDHAPHGIQDKNVEYARAAFGISGFETAFSVINTYLVEKKHIDYKDVVRLMSTNPAKILGIDRGYIKEGAVADIVLVDPEAAYVVDKNKFYSKGKNTPYDGKVLKGVIKMTLVGGKVVYNSEEGILC
ncbi:dihydroorotase [Caldanaerobius fijiensis DSM 17918]|uniref:Dihydroorotase n=1 Tax=Caldanaerobius fijiensis DSM 17918 TaxID=1121256 RepID=A0A1M4TSQ1_9THEO|nr:dihydroorotase [Caldanaerobius fijiensis]SHE47415.1 dihydroorotase [Caldanaerobius fijiensis DSM 17918]